MRLDYLCAMALGMVAIALPLGARQAADGGQRLQNDPPAWAGQHGAGPRLQGSDRTRDIDEIYGWQLMTPVERQIYRTRMRSLRTPEERDALRAQYHAEMQKRAAKRGLRLPDMPLRSQSGGALMQPQPLAPQPNSQGHD